MNRILSVVTYSRFCLLPDKNSFTWGFYGVRRIEERWKLVLSEVGVVEPTGWPIWGGGKDFEKREMGDERRAKQSIYKRVEININLCVGEGGEKGGRGEDS